MNQNKIFLSYSHRDNAWKDRVLAHLSVGSRPEDIEVWDDSLIPTGSHWEETLKRAISNSGMAVLLISADYLASDFIRRRELPMLLEREQTGLSILPILVRPCAWMTVDWLNQVQMLPSDGHALSGRSESETDTILASIAETIYTMTHRKAA